MSFGPLPPTKEDVLEDAPSARDPEKVRKEWESIRNAPEKKLDRDSWMVELPPTMGTALNFDLMQKK